MSKKHKKKKEKSTIDWKTLTASAIMDFIFSLILLIISKLID